MVRLRLSTFVASPIEEVYRHITAYGRDGPVSEEAFQEQYGAVVEREGNSFVVREDVRRYPDDEPEFITWRCTFSFPSDRTMEALDSTWAHRYDSCRSVPGGTLWRVQWDTRVGGLRGVAQYLVFRLVGHRRMRRRLLDPVMQHFEQSESGGEGG